jgi:ABC-type antimicrobial peptide transport system permease subunit
MTNPAEEQSSNINQTQNMAGKITYGILGFILGIIMGVIFLALTITTLPNDNNPHPYLVLLRILPFSIIFSYVGTKFAESKKRLKTIYALAGFFLFGGTYGLLAKIVYDSNGIIIINGWIFLIIIILGLILGSKYAGRFDKFDKNEGVENKKEIK